MKETKVQSQTEANLKQTETKERSSVNNALNATERKGPQSLPKHRVAEVEAERENLDGLSLSPHPSPPIPLSPCPLPFSSTPADRAGVARELKRDE